MFSPNVIETSEDIAGAHLQLLTLKAFTGSTSDIVVSPLSPDPGWLGPVRNRVADLAAVGSKWRLDSPQIVADYCTPFTNYASIFGGFAANADAFGNSPELWTQALTALNTAANDARAMCKKGETAFTNHLGSIKNVESLLDQSLQTGWEELADEEQQMISLAKQIVRLQDQVDRLQDSLGSAEISSGKSYFQTAATISYNVLSETSEEIPILSVLASLYTVGKMAYDLIVTDAEISDALQQIADLTVEATEAAQAAAMCKAVIQLIANLDKRVAALGSHLPAIDRMWEDEAAKLSAAVDSIAAGAKPGEMLDITTMSVAAGEWNQLAEAARSAVLATPVIGTPVQITAGPKPAIS